jgi:hypothetical protein
MQIHDRRMAIPANRPMIWAFTGCSRTVNRTAMRDAKGGRTMVEETAGHPNLSGRHRSPGDARRNPSRGR